MLPKDRDEAKRYIEELAVRLRGEFRERDNNIDDMRNLYYMRRPDVRLKPGERLIVSNKATNIVDLAVGIMSSQDMSIRVYRGVGDNTAEDEERCSKIERFLRGCVYMNNMRQNIDLENIVLTYQIRDGMACLYVIWDDSIEGDLPIYIHAIDPKEIYYEHGGPMGGLRHVVRYCTRTIADIEDEWGVELEPTADRKLREVEYIDYWGWRREDDELLVENAVIADGKWVKEPRVVEGYVDLPFVLIFGRSTGDLSPSYESLSMLYPVRNQIYDMESLMRHQRRLADLYTSLPPIVRLQAGRNIPPIDPVVGKVITLYEGEEFFFPTWPGTPPDVERALSITQMEIQEGSFPHVAYGMGPTQLSGYALSLLNDSGRIRLIQFKRNAERGWTAAFMRIMKLCATFAPNQELAVNGRLAGKPFTITLRGKEMAPYMVDVEIRPSYPQDEQRRMVMAAQAKAQGLLSLRTIQERFLDVEYPDEEEQRILVEMAMRNPKLMENRINEALRTYLGHGMEEEGEGEAKPQQPTGQELAPQTAEQNARAIATMGGIPEPAMNMPTMPPPNILPEEVAGYGTPMPGGMPPGQLNPDLALIMRMMGGLPGVS